MRIKRPQFSKKVAEPVRHIHDLCSVADAVELNVIAAETQAHVKLRTFHT